MKSSPISNIEVIEIKKKFESDTDALTYLKEEWKAQPIEERNVPLKEPKIIITKIETKEGYEVLDSLDVGICVSENEFKFLDFVLL